MMIYNTTYRNTDVEELINDYLGTPYSLIQSIRLKGIGSKRMMIEAVSPNLMSYINTVSDINYSSIELRPHGILLRINKGLENYSWVIPYYQLVIYKTESISIHAQGKFIRFKNNRLLKENKAFFDKLTKLKIACLSKNDFIYD